MAKATAAAAKKSTGKTGTVASALQKMRSAWKDAEAKSGFQQVPDGTYQCRIESASIGRSKQKKRLQVGWDLVIVNGEYANQHLFKYDGIDSPENLEWLKGTLTNLGVEIPDDITELPATLAELEGTYCEVTSKTKDEFQNVYINEALEGPDEDEDEEASEEEGDEDEDEDEEEEEAPPAKSKGKKAAAKDEEDEEDEDEEDESDEEDDESDDEDESDESDEEDDDEDDSDDEEDDDDEEDEEDEEPAPKKKSASAKAKAMSKSKKKTGR